MVGMNMRFTIINALCLLGTMSVLADEKLPVLKTGSEVYSNVNVTTITATYIYFTYNNEKGMANAKLKSLNPELQKHFHYNATKAGAGEQQQKQADIQYHAEIAGQPFVRPPDETRESPPVVVLASDLSWGTDLPSALNQAQSENKLVLLDFTGSDWCPWCIKFDHDVLSTSEFASYAGNKLVLVKLDFPRHTEQDAALKQANRELYQEFNVNGYPTYILLNPSGKELGRQVGYAEGGPSAFIAELDGFSKR
jgi:thiol-disulfide isomerase/thioredoxin